MLSDFTEEITVEILQGQRTRRSTDDSFHPQTYDLDLYVEGSEVHFHLVRNYDIKTKVPTVSFNKEKLAGVYLKEQKVVFYMKQYTTEVLLFIH